MASVTSFLIINLELICCGDPQWHISMSCHNSQTKYCYSQRFSSSNRINSYYRCFKQCKQASNQIKRIRKNGNHSKLMKSLLNWMAGMFPKLSLICQCKLTLFLSISLLHKFQFFVLIFYLLFQQIWAFIFLLSRTNINSLSDNNRSSTLFYIHLNSHHINIIDFFLKQYNHISDNNPYDSTSNKNNKQLTQPTPFVQIISFLNNMWWI